MNIGNIMLSYDHNRWIVTFLGVLAVLILFFRIIPMIFQRMKQNRRDRVAQLIYKEYKFAMAHIEYQIKTFAHREIAMFENSDYEPFTSEATFIAFIAQTYIVNRFTQACEVSYDRDNECFKYREFEKFFNTMGFDDIEEYVEFCCTHVIKEYAKYKSGISNYNLVFTPDTSLDEIVRIHNKIKFNCDYFNINGDGLTAEGRTQLSNMLKNAKEDMTK